MVRTIGRFAAVALAVALLALVARGFGLGASEVGAQTGTTVSIVDLAFDPAIVQVPADSTVSWINLGALPHTVTSDAGLFGSDVLSTGGAFTTTFTTPGSYGYTCLLHPGMTGMVVVTP
jgi:plastocyanin